MNHSLFDEASSFICACYNEIGLENRIAGRLAEVEESILHTGTYEHTYTELEHGARMAWRNSNRCIGRLFWNSLKVMDARNADSTEKMSEAIFRHIEYANNGGKIRPAITIFKQHRNEEDTAEILNHQLVRYAGYETENGTVGDPHSISFTKRCQALGWKGNMQNHEVLPLVLSMDGKDPVWMPIPSRLVMEVPILHLEFDFRDLDAKWYAVPFISDMRLEIGGISYMSAPFNGWYMETEIGARNLADEDRYHLLPAVAEAMGLDTSRNDTLWKDKALVELNIAVLHSFKREGISLVDHHTAASQFKLFEEKESVCSRELTGDWTWLIPPVSPASTHIFHKSYNNRVITPNFFYKNR